MRRSPLLALSALLLALAAPASAAPPVTPQTILQDATTPSDLRARLLDFAKSHEKSDPLAAGEAWFYGGLSFEHASARDSAILCWRQAVRLRGVYVDLEALAEALLSRQSGGDVDSAIATIQPGLKDARVQGDPYAQRFEAQLAWATFLSGHGRDAMDQFANVGSNFTRLRLWRYRYGRTALETGDGQKALELLRPLGVACRGTDEEIMPMLDKIAEALGQPQALEKQMTDLIAARDRIERIVVDRMNGRRIRFAANDEFPLSGVVLNADTKVKRRPAIVMMSPGDTLTDYDSLAVAMSNAGLTVLLLDPRGSGWSVGPTCSLPETWRGREDAMQWRVGRDVRDAVHALTKIARIDTTAIVVVGVGSLALAASQAAADDPRVRALVMLSPYPSPVDRGLVRATLARRRMPVFFTQTPEDFQSYEYTDLDYHATLEAASRVSDAHSAGTGAMAFRQDSKTTQRFLVWLKETLAARPTNAPPPTRPKKG